MAFEKHYKYRTQRDNIELLRKCVESLKTAIVSGAVPNLTTVEALLTDIAVKSDLEKMQTEANDLVETYTWLDGGTSDQRISTIVYSSAALVLSVTETFTYNGGAGTYHVATSTLS